MSIFLSTLRMALDLQRWRSMGLLLFLGLFTVGLFGQSVNGTVTTQDGSPLVGVTVLQKETTSGAITNSDGQYQVNVTGNNPVLVFSFLGFETQEVAVNGRGTVNVTMTEVALSTDEVVITALGISREKKSLTYSVQNVNTDEISEARSLNVVNSLQGKAAGLSISPSGAGVGAPSRVILRGNRSFAGSSQALFVVDGVPILGDITDINPDDIESISVLKGPAAGALYGNRGNNGAVIITTKKGKAGGFQLSIGQTYMANQPWILTDYQNEFGQGSAGQYSPASEKSWGPALNGSPVAFWSPDPNSTVGNYGFSPQPDNVADFFQTGHNSATNLSISGGNATSQTYFSYTFTDAAGVVPNNELQRHNVNLRITNKLGKRLTLDSKLTYVREDVDNELSQGESFSNPVRHAIRLPRNIRTSDVSSFEYTDAENRLRQNFWNPGSNGGANPYWIINRAINQRDVDRVIGFTSLTYELMEGLTLMGRASLDRLVRTGQNRDFVDNYIFADNGRFSVFQSETSELNIDGLLSYDTQITDDIRLNANLGGNIRKERGTSLSGNTGDALIVPNFFSIGNTSDNRAGYSFGAPRDVNSLYGFVQFAFREAIFLDVTGRNDWSSTLPAENNSFFYPSVGLNVVLNDLVELPSFFTFAKLRGSWAVVGNDTRPFQTLRTASVGAGGLNGFLTLSGTIPNADLLPEETTSIELGADIRVLDNRIGLDFTWYKSNTVNQLFSVALPVGSGAGNFFTNGGDVQNDGIEMILTVRPVVTDDFNWEILFNFAKNNSEVIAINDERPSINVGQDFLRSYRIEEGRPFGEVFSRGFERDAQDRILVGDNGLPIIRPGLTTLVANYNPDWIGGIRNQLNWKDLSLSFLIDIRQGGSVSSLSNAILFGDGQTAETLPGRDGSAVFGQGSYAQWGEAVREDGSSNNLNMDVEAFWNLVGGRNAPVGEAFAYDASNIRMREVVLGYNVPMDLGPVSGLRISLVGRNLFFFSAPEGNIDPEVLVGTGKAAEGFNSFQPPTMRSFGFNVKLDF